MNVLQLTNHIKDVICGKRIILELIDGTNVHVQLKAAQQVELSNKLKLIKVNQLPISESLGNFSLFFVSCRDYFFIIIFAFLKLC